MEVLKLHGNILEFKDIEGDLNSLYREIECDCITMPTLSYELGIRNISIIADDEGLLKDFPRLQLIINDSFFGESRLVGNILFAGFDPETGETIALSESQKEFLKSHLQYVDIGALKCFHLNLKHIREEEN